MQKPKAALCDIWVAAIIPSIIASGLYQAQAQPNPDDQMKTPLKITWRIYSGRESPYFKIKSMKELLEIEDSLGQAAPLS